VPSFAWGRRLVRPAVVALALQALVTPAVIIHALLLRYYLAP
jgi:hypothetical protein